MAIVVNFWAAPCGGKSAMAAGLFHRLKLAGVNAELTGEYAKDLVYAGRQGEMRDQIYIFGKQRARVDRLARQCEVVITDSPLPLCAVYCADLYPDSFRETIRWAWDQYDNQSFLIERTHPYDPRGRNQDEQEAEHVQEAIKSTLAEWEIPHTRVTSRDGLDLVTLMVLERLGSSH